MPEDQNRLAEIANLLRVTPETFPCPAAIVVPSRSRLV